MRTVGQLSASGNVLASQTYKFFTSAEGHPIRTGKPWAPETVRVKSCSSFLLAVPVHGFEPRMCR